MLVLKVEKVRGESGLEPGATWRVEATRSIVGRSLDADVVLDHPKVSRHHALLSVDGEGPLVENLSRYGTWVNRERIAGPTRLEHGDHVQLGGVLLRVFSDAVATEPAEGPMSIDALPSTTPPSEDVPAVDETDAVAWDAATKTFLFFGAPLEITPLAVRVLRCLADANGDWVATEAILERVWPDQASDPAYVSKYVSYVRSAMAAVLDREPELVERLRAHLLAARDAWSSSAETLADMSALDLLRELVKSRKRVGFRLSLAGAA